MSRKVIIVGGVAGGAATAARLRRLDEHAQIIMIERGEHISFANCGLPYYVGGVIPKRSDLIVQTVEGMEARFNLDVRIRTEVQHIDPAQKEIVAKNLVTGETYTESYDYLVLSPGASPVAPPIPGLQDAQNVFTVRTIPDTDAINAFLKEKEADNRSQRAIVIGGGFIGLEMAENLHRRGLEVTIVEMLPQVMAPLDYEMASVVHVHLRSKGVKLILSDGVKAFHNQGKEIELQSGVKLASDLTILAIGVRPEVHLAKTAGLELGNTGGIKVDQTMVTSNPFIYALGDAVEVQDPISGQPALIPLAGPASKQGRLVADNIAGQKRIYQGTMGTAIAQVFDLTVASVGNNEKSLRQKDIAYEVVHVHGESHVDYYPGAEGMSLKLLFHPETGIILGAQGVGGSGVDKRIDVLATAIYAGLTVEDLQELELAYAPPFGAAKDPVNHLGFAASNLREGLSHHYQWSAVEALQESGAVFVDVRPRDAKPTPLITDAVHIPLEELRNRLTELPHDRPIHIFCAVGLRGYVAERILKQQGFTALNLDGGLTTLAATKQ